MIWSFNQIDAKRSMQKRSMQNDHRHPPVSQYGSVSAGSLIDAA
jgi:hypothetical protein